jgi:hypothetical protein
MKSNSVTFFCGCLIVVSSVSIADDLELITVSKGINNYNYQVDTAANSRNYKSGVVVWSSDNRKNYSESRIYAARYKVKSKGTLKFSKPIQLSSKDYYCDSPSIAYDAVQDVYLAVWRENVGKDEVVGTMLTSLGKPTGGVFQIIAEDSVDQRKPKIVSYVDPAKSGPRTGATEVRTYFIVWVSNKYFGDEKDSGIYGVFLDQNGYLMSSEQLLYRAYVKNAVIGWMYINDLYQSPIDGKFYCGFNMIYDEQQGYTNYIRAVIARINSNGSMDKALTLDDSTDDPARAVARPVSKKITIATWIKELRYESYYQLVKKTMRKKKNPVEPTGAELLSTSIFPLDSGEATCFFGGPDILQKVRLSNKGKMVGKPVSWTVDAQIDEEMVCVHTNDSNYLVLFGTDFVNVDEADIFAVVVDPN